MMLLVQNEIKLGQRLFAYEMEEELTVLEYIEEFRDYIE